MRPELSVKNKYWIEKHRYYELKHFCLQYKYWKKLCVALDSSTLSPLDLERALSRTNFRDDKIARIAVAKTYYKDNINLVENTSVRADKELSSYILKAVTEELSYTTLKTKYDIPCGRDMFYDRYRKFFWLLDKEKY